MAGGLLPAKESWVCIDFCQPIHNPMVSQRVGYDPITDDPPAQFSYPPAGVVVAKHDIQTHCGSLHSSYKHFESYCLAFFQAIGLDKFGVVLLSL